MSTEPYILDVDTGIDDALALALAVNSPEVELLAVTTLAGNVEVARTTENSRRVLTWLGATEVPVHRGASRPLAKPPQYAKHVHGNTGLGAAELPEGSNPLGRDRGPAAVIRLASERPGEITLVLTGPLTNLAIALNVEPGLSKLLKRVVVMGGAFFVSGNITAHAEFNIFADPDAAAQVFSAPIPDLTVVGLDVTHQAMLTRTVWSGGEQAVAAAARLAHLVYAETFTARGKDGEYLHDPMALAIAIDPTLAAYRTGSVDAMLDGDKRGKTFLSEGRGDAKVVVSVDVERFLTLFHQRFGLASD